LAIVFLMMEPLAILMMARFATRLGAPPTAKSIKNHWIIHKYVPLKTEFHALTGIKDGTFHMMDYTLTRWIQIHIKVDYIVFQMTREILVWRIKDQIANSKVGINATINMLLNVLHLIIKLAFKIKDSSVMHPI